MWQNPHIVTAVRALTVRIVYTAAGTYFPSSHSYHSTKVVSPQSAVLSGFIVPGRAVTTDHTPHTNTHAMYSQALM